MKLIYYKFAFVILLLCFFTYKNTVKEGLTNKMNIVVLGKSILNLLDGSKIKDIYAQLKKVPTMTKPADFVYMIEPSAEGGKKIVDLIH